MWLRWGRVPWTITRADVGGPIETAKRQLKLGHTAELRGHMRKRKHIHEVKLTKGALPPTHSALLARIKEIKQARDKSKLKHGVHRS